LIGQGILPLEAALASAQGKAGSLTAFAWGPAATAQEAAPSQGALQTMIGELEQPAARPVDRETAPEPPEVPIETRVVPGRPGRPRTPEKFPFGALTPAAPNENGKPCGPCFFIRVEDNPERCVAAALKRHRPKKFITRKVPGGTWVWRRS
jgi:hypothetical protein